MTGRSRTVVALAVGLVAVTTALAGCSDDGSGVDPGQPLASGGFEDELADTPSSDADESAGGSGDVPIPADAQSSGEPVTDGATTTQSFLVEGVTPEQLIQDYEALAADQGWEVESPAAQSGSTDWQMTLAQGDQTLVVSTSPADSDDQSDQTQLSLQVTSS